jgi:Predicted transcriptional regulators
VRPCWIAGERSSRSNGAWGRPLRPAPDFTARLADGQTFGPTRFALAFRPSLDTILNQMVQYRHAVLDSSFSALSDPTRRGVLERLGRADASITELAERFHITLTGMKKHVAVLERAGLVTTEKVGRVRTCRLGARRLEEETAWLEKHRQVWDARFDQLDQVVEELKKKEKNNEHRKRK